MTSTTTATAVHELVPPVPAAGIAAAVARRLFERASIQVGVTVSVDGSAAGLRILRPDAFHARLGARGLIGFGESYVAGEWEADDLAGVLTVYCRDLASLVPGWMQRLRRLRLPTRPRNQANTVDGSRRNVSHHYDLSNDLFSCFLDPSMSYSAALFDRPGLTLHEAQLRKIDRVLDRAEAGPGTRLLEIGTGWGELAIRAARRGAEVHSITLSAEQRDLALARVAAAGVADRVVIDLCDYREVRARYDAVVSVEMIEAVGHEYWDEYMRIVSGALVPGGRAVIQAITMDHHRMLATRDTATWITTYIFPGGCLPSLRALDGAADRAGLRRADRLAFGADYAETLRRWDQCFAAAAERVSALGFDEEFRRLWHFYLAYCQAGFAAGYLDVSQTTYVRERA